MKTNSNFIQTVENTSINQSMIIDPFLLNDVRKMNNNYGTFFLNDYGTSLIVDLSGPYLSYGASSIIDEGNSVTISLNNTLPNSIYTYIMATIGLRNLCTPAYIYLVISVIAIVVGIIQNMGNASTYCMGNYSCEVSNLFLI